MQSSSFYIYLNDNNSVFQTFSLKDVEKYILFQCKDETKNYFLEKQQLIDNLLQYKVWSTSKFSPIIYDNLEFTAKVYLSTDKDQFL